MSRFAEIEAEQRDLRKQLEIMERINRLEREKMSLQQPVDLTQDEDDDGKVKVEQPEKEGTDIGGNESREATQNYDGGGEAFSANQDFNAVDEARPRDRNERTRPEFAAARRHERHVEGPPNRAGRPHHQNTTTRGANSFSFSHRPPAASQQPHLNGLPPPTGLPPPATFRQRSNGNPVQQWQLDVPEHDSTYGSGNISPPEMREPVPSHEMAEGRPYFRQDWNRADDRGPLFERGSAPGQAQPNQAAMSLGFHPLRGTQTVRRGIMGQPVGIVEHERPAQTHVTAAPTAALEGYAYDKHSVFQTLVGKPDGNGFWELRCYVCGANVTKNGGKAQKGKPQGGQFFSGVQGFQNHIRICHPAELGEAGKNLSPATIIERCKVRELSHDDINAMRSKHRGAYKIEKKVGASADANSAVRKPHPWKLKKRNDPPDIVGKHVPRKRRRAQVEMTPQEAQSLGGKSGSVTARPKGKQRRAPTPAEVGGDEDDVDELQDNEDGELENESEEEPPLRPTRGRKTNTGSNGGSVLSIKASAQQADDLLARFGDPADMEGDPAEMEQDVDAPKDDENLTRLSRRVGMEEVSVAGNDSGGGIPGRGLR